LFHKIIWLLGTFDLNKFFYAVPMSIRKQNQAEAADEYDSAGADSFGPDNSDDHELHDDDDDEDDEDGDVDANDVDQNAEEMFADIWRQSSDMAMGDGISTVTRDSV
jgi:hypothetical protein